MYILREVKDPNKFMKLNIQFLTSTYEELKCIEWVPNSGFFPNGKILFNKKNLLLFPHSINDKAINQIIGTIDRDISGILEKLNNNEYDLESLTSKSSFSENKKVDKNTLYSQISNIIENPIEEYIEEIQSILPYELDTHELSELEKVTD